jgi:archaellum component FlaC
MSLNFVRSDVSRAEGDIADLTKKLATETSKEADLIRKQGDLYGALNGKLSPSQLQSKMRDLERVTNDLARVQNAKGDIQKRISQKRADLSRHQERLAREEATERKKLDDKEKRRRQERDRYEQGLRSKLLAMRTLEQSQPRELATAPLPDHDVFISHASEDKDAFVRPMAEALRDAGIKVWYDEFSLTWGDSLRKNIDRGLASSRFGIVVLSEAFFRKQWPQQELNGLVTLELDGKARILPIWHKVSKDEVRQFSPTLADKVAMNTAMSGVEDIVRDVLALLEPLKEKAEPPAESAQRERIFDMNSES